MSISAQIQHQVPLAYAPTQFVQIDLAPPHPSLWLTRLAIGEALHRKYGIRIGQKVLRDYLTEDSYSFELRPGTKNSGLIPYYSPEVVPKIAEAYRKVPDQGTYITAYELGPALRALYPDANVKFSRNWIEARLTHPTIVSQVRRLKDGRRLTCYAPNTPKMLGAIYEAELAVKR